MIGLFLLFLVSAGMAAPVGVWSNATSRLAQRVVALDGTSRSEVVLEGGHGLTEFTASLWLRSSVGCVPSGWSADHRLHVRYEAWSAWYVAGCSLLNGVYTRPPPATWRDEWRQRRACCAVPPEADLHSPGGLSKSVLTRRSEVKGMLWGGSRSDFGLTLTVSGLAFGVGHRDFAHRSPEGRLSPGRPVRDTTLEANATLVDGRWHHVAAIRRFEPDSDDGENLEVYVDGSRQDAARRQTGGDVGAVAAAAALASARGGESLLPRELHDAPHFVAVGQLFRGCLFDVALHRRAWSPTEVTAESGRADLPIACEPREQETRPPLLENGSPRPRPPAIPLYYLAHSDNGSLVMRDQFLASLRDDRMLIEPREVRLDALTGSQKLRYGPKGDLILRALAENPPDSIVLVADLDIRFFRPIARIIELYAAMRDADVVFQRDEDYSLNANLGFMALRCRAHVADFFRIVADMATQYARGDAPKNAVKGGDQRIVNVALRNPRRLPQLPHLAWALFPTELMTRSIDQQRGFTYKHEANHVLYHVNDYGSDRISPDKARSNKIALLAAAERRHRHALGL